VPSAVLKVPWSTWTKESGTKLTQEVFAFEEGLQKLVGNLKATGK
jgi:hypothetical protein